MQDLALLFHGFAVVLTPFNFGLMLLGIVLGVVIGVLPGLGAANGIAILLPLVRNHANPEYEAALCQATNDWLCKASLSSRQAGCSASSR